LFTDEDDAEPVVVGRSVSVFGRCLLLKATRASWKYLANFPDGVTKKKDE